MVLHGIFGYLMVPYGNGTLWYLMVPYGTIRYHMIPLPPEVGSRACWTQKVFFRILTFEEKVIQNCKKWKKQKQTKNVKTHHLERNVKYLTSGKESQRNSGHFGPEIIENGQLRVELWYFLVYSWNMVPYGAIWYHMVPFGTIWYHMVPYGTLWYHKVPYGTIRYLMVP